MEYQQIRQTRIRDLSKEKIYLNRLLNRNRKQAEEYFADFCTMREGYSSRADTIIKRAEELKKYLQEIEKGTYNPQGVVVGIFGKGMILMGGITPEMKEVFAEDVRGKARAFNSLMASSSEAIGKMENAISYSVRHHYVGKESEDALKAIQILSQKAYSTNLDSISDFLYALSGAPGQEFIKAYAIYKTALDNCKEKIPKSRLKKLAQDNIASLIEETEKQKTYSYPNSLEDKLLAYISYEQARREALHSSKTNPKREDYLSYLESKTEDILVSLNGISYEETLSSLDKMYQREDITEDELVFFRLVLQKELSPKQAESQKEDLESKWLRAALLQDDYKVPENKSKEIAERIRDEDVSRVPYAISMALGKDTTMALLRTNPELFLFDNTTLDRFITMFNDTIREASKYSNEFNIQKDPSDFASFDSLFKTRERIRELERRALPRQTMRQRLEMDLSAQAERAGLKSSDVIDVLQWSFWFKGSYLVGRNVTSEGHLKENIRRHREIEDKDFQKTLSWLIANNAVLSDRGYSINSHLKEIENETLRNAIGDVLSRPATQD